MTAGKTAFKGKRESLMWKYYFVPDGRSMVYVEDSFNELESESWYISTKVRLNNVINLTIL